MASPVADSYSAPSSAAVYGGRFIPGLRGSALLGDLSASGTWATNVSGMAGSSTMADLTASGVLTGVVWPTWRTGMVVNTWANVTNGNTLSDIDPGVAPNDISPAGQDYEARGMTLGLLSWVGGAWDEVSGDFWIPIGGGHTDYGGNEPYKINLFANAPSWVMVRPPSGALPGPAVVTRDTNEASGVYSDGRMRGQHTYNNCIWVPNKGPVVTRGSSFYISAPNVPLRKMNLVDPITGEATMVLDYASAVTSPGGSIGMSAWDTARNRLWSTANSTDSGLLSVNPTDWSVTQYGVCTWAAASSAWHYAPRFDALLGVTQGQLRTFSIGSMIVGSSLYTPGNPTQSSGAYSSGWGINSSFDGFGSCWVEDLGVLALYQQVSNTTEISTLTPTGTINAPWTKGKMIVDAANTVTPPVSPPDGLMNRFFYSSKLKGFFMVPGTTQDVYFFATA